MLPDLSRLSSVQRLAAADLVHPLKDFDLPPLHWFNSAPCSEHSSASEGALTDPPCQQCGIDLRAHQRVGIAWLYFARKGLIADFCGSGKTSILAGLIASIKEAKELDASRVLVVCRSAAVEQWYEQLQRMLPWIDVMTATGTRPQRVEKYLRPWEVCLISQQMLISDVDIAENFALAVVAVDDVDPLRHPDTATALAIRRVVQGTDRVVILTATPLQKRLEELYNLLELIGGRDTFGSRESFFQRYVREKHELVWNPKMKKKVKKSTVVGYDHVDEFAQLIAPLALRRSVEDVSDVNLPAVNLVNVFLDLYPAQRKKYTELQRGVLEIIKAGSAKVTRKVAKEKFVYGAQICTGLVALGEEDRPNTSCKLDWLEDKLVDGDFSDDKTVVFFGSKNAIRATQARLDRAGVSYETIWADESRPEVRQRSLKRFWQDSVCKVLLGTTAIEQSIDLQCARHLVNVDTILNAARMTQLTGRIRRLGSSHSAVYVHNLFTADTQEARYLPILRREQALQDQIWSEQSEMYEALTPLALLELVGKSRETVR